MTALSCSVPFGHRKYIQVKEPLEFKAGTITVTPTVESRIEELLKIPKGILKTIYPLLAIQRV